MSNNMSNNELEVLEHIQSVSDKHLLETMHHDYDTHINMLAYMEEFLYENKCILYGGLAIDTLMPRSKKIYTKYTLPDFDCYHHNALVISKKLADYLSKKGYTLVMVKKGVLFDKTYRIYANTVAVADITAIPKVFYQSLIRNASDINGRFVIQKEFLRYSLHWEFAKPKSSSWRWNKLYTRYVSTYNELKLSSNTVNSKMSLQEYPNIHPMFEMMQDFTLSSSFIHNGIQRYLKGVLPLQWSNAFGVYQYLVNDVSEFKNDLEKFVTRKLGSSAKVTQVSHVAMLFSVPDMYYFKLVRKNEPSIMLCSVYNLQNVCISYIKINKEKIAVIDFILSMVNYIIMDPLFSEELHEEVKHMTLLLQKHLESYTSNQHKRYRFNLKCIGNELTFTESIKKWLSGKVNVYKPAKKVTKKVTVNVH